MEITKAKWFKTTGGKIGIAIGALALVTGVVLLVKHFNKKGETKKDETKKDETKTEQGADPKTDTKTNPTGPFALPLPENADLPNAGVGCGPVRTAFDRVYNYVKCGGVWYTISKDKIKIPKWKSLAGNKTATDLLNNKYPN